MSDNTDPSQRAFGVRKNNSARFTLKDNRNSMLKGLKSAPADKKTTPTLRSIPSAPEPRSLTKSYENELKNSSKIFNDLKSVQSQESLKKSSDNATTGFDKNTELLVDLQNEVSELEEGFYGLCEAIKEYKSLYEIRLQELESIHKDIKDLQNTESTTSTTILGDDDHVTILELTLVRDELLAQIEIDSKRLELALNKFEAGRKIQESLVLNSEQQAKNCNLSQKNTNNSICSVTVDEQFEDLLYIAECEYEAAREKNLEVKGFGFHMLYNIHIVETPLIPYFFSTMTGLNVKINDPTPNLQLSIDNLTIDPGFESRYRT